MNDERGVGRNIEELLRLRSELDREMHSKYAREVSILFTDIKGSTSYFETRGDLAGRAMVQAHNDLLFPIIGRHGGSVIKTIGDAIMASFEVPADAVETAVDMQRALEKFNRGRPANEKILVRIGVNHGTGLVEDKDVFGDVVNVAARIESLADGGEVLVSGPVYQAVRNSDDIVVRYHSTTEVKGKAEPVEVYRVVWREDLEAGAASGAAFGSYAVRGGPAPGRLLTLEFSREGDRLKLSASEKTPGHEKTLRHYEEKDASAEEVKRLCSEAIGLLNRANNRGKVGKEILTKLKEVGQRLYDVLLTPKAKELVMSTGASALIVSIDDRLVHVPWELLYDGNDFLCLKFAMGRIVTTRQSVGAVKQRSLQRPLRMLILSDPKTDLAASYSEGIAIRDDLEGLSGHVIANLKSGPVGLDYVKGKSRNYDMLHYAGHADYDTDDPGSSGWLLSDGKLSARDVTEMAGSKPMPALVFSNACHSGQTGEWSLGEDYGYEIYGLANAFLLSGVQHYIGTFWEILDEPSAEFAKGFYKALVGGAPVGEAVRLARLQLVKLYGEDNIVWSSYMLYGDPTFEYMSAGAEPVVAAKREPEPQYAHAGGHPRAAAYEVTADISGRPAKAGRGIGRYLPYAAALAVVLAVGAYAYTSRQDQPITAPEAASTAVQQVAVGNEPSAQPPRATAVAKAPPPAPAGAPAAVPAPERRASSSVDDPAKKERIRKLAKELAERYRSGGAAQDAAVPDGPRPLTLAFMGFAASGASEGEDRLLVSAIQDRVMESGKVEVVERELIEAILDELDLSTSDLADKRVALKLGKVLSARYIATGTLYRSGGEYTVSVRLIETETTAIKGSVSQGGKGGLDAFKVAGPIADSLVAKLTAADK